MKKIGDITSKIKNMIYLSDTCDKHTYYKNGEEHIKKVSLIEIDGEAVCPLCESAKRQQALENEIYEIHKDKIENPNKFIFLKDSLVIDGTLLNARFSNYQTDNDEERNNLELIKQSLRDHLDGKRFTLWLQGNAGAGKSHLAYSFAHAVNESGNNKVLFVDVNELMKQIRETFSNNKLHDSEQAIVRRLVEADLLVLDDIGAEVGSIDTTKQASDFVSRVIFAIFNGRQGKTTLVTTNVSSAHLKAIYDARTFSRMFSNYRFVKFEQTKDKRFRELPF